MKDSEYETLIAETQRLLDATAVMKDAHNKACHDWNEAYQKLEYETTRRKIITEYLKEQQELSDLEAQYQLEQAQAAEMP